MKKVLVTGSKGFVGKNLIQTLLYNKEVKVLEYSRSDSEETLKNYLNEADVVFHLAGVNRPEKIEEFSLGNTGLTEKIVSYLTVSGKKTPVVLTSSTQALLDNPYGKSKKNAEDLVFNYANKSGANVFVYRLPNIFGKWSRPNYNSVVATFCYNIARDLPIQINDPNVLLNYIYIDDLVNDFINILNEKKQLNEQFADVGPIYSILLGDLAELIKSFKRTRQERSIPNMSDPMIKKLYSTYLNFLPMDQFSYPLKMNVDDRGSFTEFIKTTDSGQVSVNVSKPGITRGNHWHHTKNEKFLVVSGVGTINFRAVGGTEVVTYHVSGEKLEVVEIPTGYTHNIVNTGISDLVTLMWANEPFNPEIPDTNFLIV